MRWNLCRPVSAVTEGETVEQGESGNLTRSNSTRRESKRAEDGDDQDLGGHGNCERGGDCGDAAGVGAGPGAGAVEGVGHEGYEGGCLKLMEASKGGEIEGSWKVRQRISALQLSVREGFDGIRDPSVFSHSIFFWIFNHEKLTPVPRVDTDLDVNAFAI